MNCNTTHYRANSSSVPGDPTIARSESEIHQFGDATLQLDEALKAAEEQRSHVHNDELRTSYFAVIRKCYELYVDILMMRHKEEPEAKFDQLALEMSEAGKARTLLDAISMRNSLGPGNGNIKETPELEKLHTVLNQAYEDRLNLMLDGKREGDIIGNAAEIRRLVDEYSRLQDLSRDRLDFPEPRAKALTGSELMSRANEAGFAIIEYSLGEKRSYSWVIDNGVLTSSVLPSRKAIGHAVEKWRALALARQLRTGESFSVHSARVQLSDRDYLNTLRCYRAHSLGRSCIQASTVWPSFLMVFSKPSLSVLCR